jgi:hypothetical protein
MSWGGFRGSLRREDRLQCDGREAGVDGRNEQCSIMQAKSVVVVCGKYGRGGKRAMWSTFSLLTVVTAPSPPRFPLELGTCTS